MKISFYYIYIEQTFLVYRNLKIYIYVCIFFFMFYFHFKIESKAKYFSAPKLKGRPRRKRKKRSASPGESSNESEASVASTSKSAPASSNVMVPSVGRPPSSVVRRSERKTSAEEKKFITDVQNFMNSRGTPVGKMPLLGYRQSQYLCDVFFFF